MLAESFGVDRGGRDDQPQIGSLRQKTLDVAEQEVDIERPFVRFVQNDRIVVIEKTIVLGFGEQDAVGHQFDKCLRPRAVAKADFEAHVATQRRPKLVGQPRGDRPRGDAARLSVADHGRRAAAHLQADFRQLGGFAGPRFAAHHHDRMGLDRLGDFILLGQDRQVVVIAHSGQRRFAALPHGP